VGALVSTRSNDKNSPARRFYRLGRVLLSAETQAKLKRLRRLDRARIKRGVPVKGALNCWFSWDEWLALGFNPKTGKPIAKKLWETEGVSRTAESATPSDRRGSGPTIGGGGYGDAKDRYVLVWEL
jgi:hypothetical protein